MTFELPHQETETDAATPIDDSLFSQSQSRSRQHFAPNTQIIDFCDHDQTPSLVSSSSLDPEVEVTGRHVRVISPTTPPHISTTKTTTSSSYTSSANKDVPTIDLNLMKLSKHVSKSISSSPSKRHSRPQTQAQLYMAEKKERERAAAKLARSRRTPERQVVSRREHKNSPPSYQTAQGAPSVTIPAQPGRPIEDIGVDVKEESDEEERDMLVRAAQMVKSAREEEKPARARPETIPQPNKRKRSSIHNDNDADYVEEGEAYDNASDDDEKRRYSRSRRRPRQPAPPPPSNLQARSQRPKPLSSSSNVQSLEDEMRYAEAEESTAAAMDLVESNVYEYSGMGTGQAFYTSKNGQGRGKEEVGFMKGGGAGGRAIYSSISF